SPQAKSPPSSDSTTSFALPIVRSSNAPPPVVWSYVNGAAAMKSSLKSPPSANAAGDCASTTAEAIAAARTVLFIGISCDLLGSRCNGEGIRAHDRARPAVRSRQGHIPHRIVAELRRFGAALCLRHANRSGEIGPCDVE